MTTERNIVVIVMDTARADIVDTTYNGTPVTPNISALIRNGSKFTNAFSTAPWTLPSHASLFTGLYPSKHGAHAGHKTLNKRRPTLQEIFSEAGYETVGVSNNIWIGPSFGFDRGFDTFIRGWQYIQAETDMGRIGLTTHGREQWLSIAKGILNGNPIKNFINTLYAGYRFTRQTDDGAERTNRRLRKWLDSRDNEDPFFLFINYLEPHLEYGPPKEYANQFLSADVSYSEATEINQNAWKYVTNQVDHSEEEFEMLKALYAGETAYLDHRIGELIETFKSEGIWENTIFLVLGDHGENIGDHGLMDHQYCLYDTLLHVPLIVHGSKFAEKQRSDELVQLVDLAPTLLDEAGIEALDFRDQLQGQSLHDPDFGREYVIGEYMAPQPSPDVIEQRVGDPHGVIDQFNCSLRCIRTDRFKLIRGSNGSEELYDIRNDPGETHDVVDEFPEVRTRLMTILDDWLASFNAADTTDDVSMDQSTEQRLEDLGYLQ